MRMLSMLILVSALLALSPSNAAAVPSDRWVLHLENDLGVVADVIVTFNAGLFERFPILDLPIEDGTRPTTVRITRMQGASSLSPGESIPVLRTSVELKTSVFRYTVLASVIERITLKVGPESYDLAVGRVQNLPICIRAESTGYTVYGIRLSALLRDASEASTE